MSSDSLYSITALVLFFNLNSWSVTESSEARYAEISKEMLDTGDWIHPQLMGIYHYHKPPMTYWITAVSYKIFGVTPFAARFFLQLSPKASPKGHTPSCVSVALKATPQVVFM